MHHITTVFEAVRMVSISKLTLYGLLYKKYNTFLEVLVFIYLNNCIMFPCYFRFYHQLTLVRSIFVYGLSKIMEFNYRTIGSLSLTKNLKCFCDAWQPRLSNKVFWIRMWVVHDKSNKVCRDCMRRVGKLDFFKV